MTAAEIDRAAHDAGGHVGLTAEDTWAHPAMSRVVRVPTGSPAWRGGPPALRVAVFRRPASRPATDFGPMALVRVAPPDEWTRVTPGRHLKGYGLVGELPDGWPRADAD